MQGTIIDDYVICCYGNLTKITPVHLFNKREIQVPNYQIVTRGNLRNNNKLLQQLWNGTISIKDVLTPAT